ncbi:MAG: DUF1674 domain-containing protein [Methylobacteriaceae bacterium]|nr:DUF1674 domain-containing protein [Methylobacteriaceae bacterium]
MKEKEKSDAVNAPRVSRTLTPAAERALAEAAERRKAREEASPQTEVGGREGLDPTRYGDWEVKGLASDF